MYNTVIFKVENGICNITLNRPDVFNSFNEELSAEFIDALKKAGKDENVRVVIISGHGKFRFQFEGLSIVNHGSFRIAFFEQHLP